MCIGFSFVGLLSFAIGHLQNIITRLLSRKPFPEVGVMNQNVIKVENKPCQSEDLKKMIMNGSLLEKESKETQAAMVVRIQKLEEHLSKNGQDRFFSPSK